MEQKLDKKINDIKDGEVIAVTVNGKPVALAKYNGRLYALDGKCTHHGAPLGEGKLDNGKLICPWHSGAFDIATGKAQESTPWVTDINVHKVRIDSATGEIFVE